MLQSENICSNKCNTSARYKCGCWFRIRRLHRHCFVLPAQLSQLDHRTGELLTPEKAAGWLPQFLPHSWNRKASIKQDLLLRNVLLPQLAKHFSKRELSKSPKACSTYLHSILTASTSSSFNQRVPHVNNSTDPISIGMELSFKGLVLLVFALHVTKPELLEAGQRAPEVFSWAERAAQVSLTHTRRFVYSLT